jgi:single-strand DNA-binding protein
LYVEGKIQSRSFDDRDGNKKYVTEIIADSLLVLDAKRHDQPSNTNEAEQSLEPSSGTDVIPF